MPVVPYPYPARASLHDTVVARSTSCLWLGGEGAPAQLYFPEADVDRSALGDGDGDGPGTGRPLIAHRAPERPELADHVTFDTDRVRVEVLDGGEDDPGGPTYKRFPTWGDATDLIDLLDVRPEGALAFTSTVHPDGRRPVVEGSQMLGQALVAAGRRLPGRRAVSAGMVFLRAADTAHPLHIDLTELSIGRTFAALGVQVRQGGRACAAGTLLLDATAPELVRHAAAPPDVPGPSHCPPYDMGVTGRDVRVVDGAYTNDPDAPTGPPVLDAWVRFRRVPDDPALHTGLMAQFTGHMSIAAALRPHAGIGQDQAHRTLSTAVNAIHLSCHRPVRADRWMLYHHRSTFAGDGMTHAECRVYQEGTELVASFTVEGMVRPFAGPTPPAGGPDGDRAL